IENEATKKELGAGSFNPQIVDSSHLLVFAAHTAITKEHIENYIRFIGKERNTPEEELSGFKNSIESYLLNRTGEENFIWATKQAYIALGTGLIAAADLQVDATPMEGFDSEKFDEILGL